MATLHRATCSCVKVPGFFFFYNKTSPSCLPWWHEDERLSVIRWKHHRKWKYLTWWISNYLFNEIEGIVIHCSVFQIILIRQSHTCCTWHATLFFLGIIRNSWSVKVFLFFSLDYVSRIINDELAEIIMCNDILLYIRIKLFASSIMQFIVLVHILRANRFYFLPTDSLGWTNHL